MQIVSLGNFIVVDIRKPLSITGDYDFCRVRKDYFDIARKRGKAVLVRTPNGERVLFPKSMKGFTVVKEAFLFPDRPMSLYEITVPHGEKKPDEAYQFA